MDSNASTYVDASTDLGVHTDPDYTADVCTYVDADANTHMDVSTHVDACSCFDPTRTPVSVVCPDHVVYVEGFLRRMTEFERVLVAEEGRNRREAERIAMDKLVRYLNEHVLPSVSHPDSLRGILEDIHLYVKHIPFWYGLDYMYTLHRIGRTPLDETEGVMRDSWARARAYAYDLRRYIPNVCGLD